MIRSKGKRLQIIKELGQAIKPGFPCLPNCGACCRHPIQMLTVEWEALLVAPSARRILAANVTTGRLPFATQVEEGVVKIQDSAGGCPFVEQTTGACRIYDLRPFTCRAYGQTALMPCEKAVRCPPGLEIPAETWLKWGELAGIGGPPISPALFALRLKAIQAWRDRHVDRLLCMPTTDEELTELRALLIAVTEPSSMKTTDEVGEP